MFLCIRGCHVIAVLLFFFHLPFAWSFNYPARLLFSHLLFGTNNDLKCIYQQRLLPFPCLPNKVCYQHHLHHLNTGHLEGLPTTGATFCVTELEILSHIQVGYHLHYLSEYIIWSGFLLDQENQENRSQPGKKWKTGKTRTLDHDYVGDL